MMVIKNMDNFGPNVKKLFIKIMSYKAVPTGGGIAAGIEFFRNTELRKEIVEAAKKDTLKAIELMKTASDNPYGDDDEAIAQAIYEKIIEKEAKRNENNH